MRRQVWNLKRDTAEKPIVEALRQVGAEVWRVTGTGCPDVLVRFQGHLWAAEVKTGKGKETKKQGAFPIWRTVDDALKAIGSDPMMIIDTHTINGQQKGRHLSREQERRDWLIGSAFLNELPSEKQDVSDAGRDLLNLVFRQMQQLGLYSRKAKQDEARWGIRKLVGQIRKGR